MSDDLQRLLHLIDRVLMHIDHDVPPEREVLDELREVSNKMRLEHALFDLIDPKQ